MTFACVEDIPVPVAPPSLPGQRDLFDEPELLDEDPYNPDVRCCSRCNDSQTYSRLLGKCPRCGSPEFSLVLKESNAMPPAKKTKLETAHPGSKVTKSKLSKLIKDNAPGDDQPKRGRGRPRKDATSQAAPAKTAEEKPKDKGQRTNGKTYKDTFSPSEFMKNAATGKINTKAKPEASSEFSAEIRDAIAAGWGMLPVALLDHSPTNARTEAEIEADPETQDLADSMKLTGLVEPIVVRVKGNRFETVVGHRRRVAARRLGWSTVRCIIRKLTDEEALGEQIAENRDRKDLNPIQEAVQFRNGMEALKLNQTEFAKRYKISQPLVSTRLSLLSLPEGLQGMITAKYLTPTKGRDLAIVADLPNVMETVEKRLAHQIKEANQGRSREEGIIPLDDDDFDNALGAAVEDHLRCMMDDHRGPVFKPTASQRKQLDVRTVNFTGGIKEPWAANVALWDELQLAAKREIEEAARESSPAAQSSRAAEGTTKPATRAEETLAATREQETAAGKPKPETVSPEHLARRAERAAAV